MPNVPQLDWSKLTPKPLKTKQTHGTVDFDIINVVKTRNTLNGDVLVRNKPELHAFKCAKCGVISSGRREFDRHYATEH